MVAPKRAYHWSAYPSADDHWKDDQPVAYLSPSGQASAYRLMVAPKRAYRLKVAPKRAYRLLVAPKRAYRWKVFRNLMVAPGASCHRTHLLEGFACQPRSSPFSVCK